MKVTRSTVIHMYPNVLNPRNMHTQYDNYTLYKSSCRDNYSLRIDIE